MTKFLAFGAVKIKGRGDTCNRQKVMRCGERWFSTKLNQGEGPMVFLRFVIRERNEMYIFIQLMITGILICDRRQRLNGVLI